MSFTWRCLVPFFAAFTLLWSAASARPSLAGRDGASDALKIAENTDWQAAIASENELAAANIGVENSISDEESTKAPEGNERRMALAVTASMGREQMDVWWANDGIALIALRMVRSERL